ncbi:MAG: hypothetical protein LQ342_007794 [Letrouitia transgressa]|nr:MAG: hypothetical protein LQ342_007794 [Letrouitia transgressa]
MRSFQSPILFLFSFLAFIACVGPFAHADSSNPSKEGHVIRERAANKTLYKPLYQKPSNSTPRFLNLTHKEVNPQRIAANAKHKVSPRSIDLFKRQSGPAGTGTCAPGTPCSNGACCSKSGFCGYSPDFCGSANCISNCGAKAECGQYAAAGKQKCPLNASVALPPSFAAPAAILQAVAVGQHQNQVAEVEGLLEA